MQKLNIEAFLLAAEAIQERRHEFACVAIGGKEMKERILFQSIFGITCDGSPFDVFDAIYSIYFEKLPTREELIEIRIMALCLAAEIARLKNNKQTSGF